MAKKLFPFLPFLLSIKFQVLIPSNSHESSRHKVFKFSCCIERKISQVNFREIKFCGQRKCETFFVLSSFVLLVNNLDVFLKNDVGVDHDSTLSKIFFIIITSSLSHPRLYETETRKSMMKTSATLYRWEKSMVKPSKVLKKFKNYT